VHRVKTILAAMPPGTTRTLRQRSFAARWTNPKTARRQESKAAEVAAGLRPPPEPKTPAYDAPLETQIVFWRRYPIHLPLPLRFVDDTQRINERLAETMIAIRRLRPSPGVYHSDSQSRRSQWVNMVAQTFAHPTEDLFALIQSMGVVLGDERDWIAGDSPRFSRDVDHSTPLDVLAFFAMAGLTPVWVGRLREFAMEYLAAHNSPPEFANGITPLFADIQTPLIIHLDSSDPSQHSPPSVKGNNDTAMWSAEEEVGPGVQGGGLSGE
jgi:hypothetical protein